MTVREHKIGHGTIAYTGESAEYWRQKSERLVRGRILITRVLLILAGVVAVTALSPLGPHGSTAEVVSVPPAAARSQVIVVGVRVPAPGTGSGSSQLRSLQWPADASSPRIGDRLEVTTLPGGRAVAGRSLIVDAWALATILALIGFGRLSWQRLRRGEVIRFR